MHTAEPICNLPVAVLSLHPYHCVINPATRQACVPGYNIQQSLAEYDCLPAVCAYLHPQVPKLVHTCRYNPITDTYRNLSSLPEPRTRGGADILGGLLYYVGGFANESAGVVPRPYPPPSLLLPCD